MARPRGTEDRSSLDCARDITRGKSLHTREKKLSQFRINRKIMTEPMEQDDDEPLSKVVEREDQGDTGSVKICNSF